MTNRTQESKPIELYTLKETAQLLKITYPTALNYIKTGKIKAVRVGKHYLIKRDTLEELLDPNKQ